MARVGASSLTRLELEAQVPGEAGPEQRRRFVEDWVRRQLLYQEALERQVHERPRIQRLVEQAREDVIVAAYLDSEFGSRSIEIDPGEVQSYYDSNPGEFTRQEDEIRAQHILVDSRRDAESLRQELLRDGGFEGRAAEVSLDAATAGSSGDLGYFTARERPELWEACADLQPGEVSDVVASGSGWHIVRLRDRRRAGSLRSLDEAGVRQQIEEGPGPRRVPGAHTRPRRQPAGGAQLGDRRNLVEGPMKACARWFLGLLAGFALFPSRGQAEPEAPGPHRRRRRRPGGAVVGAGAADPAPAASSKGATRPSSSSRT